MNKKALISIGAAVVVIGGIIAMVALRGKDDGGDVNEPALETYTLESATNSGKITFKLGRDLGYKPVDGTSKGSLILENEEKGTKMTFYFKHTDKKSIIAGEKGYAGGYYDYNEYQVAGHDACSVKKNKQEDGTPWRVEFNMILNQESEYKYNGVSVYFENPGASEDKTVNLEQLFSSEDIRNMLESMTYEAE